MTQTRIQDYGSPVTAQSLKSLSGSMSPAGLLSGNQLAVYSGNTIQLNPGVCITNQGVVIIEDEIKYISVSLGTNAQDYTIYYAHVDENISGGVPAILMISTGLLSPSVIGGVLIGYFRWPGHGSLSPSQFIQPSYINLGTVAPTANSADYVFPIQNHGYLVTLTSGAALSYSSTWDSGNMYLNIANNGITNGTATLTFPFKVKDLPYAKLQVLMGVDINATVSFLFIDTGNNIDIITAVPITGVSDITPYIMTLTPGSAQAANGIVYVQAQLNLAVGKSVKLQAIGLTPYNAPV